MRQYLVGPAAARIHILTTHTDPAITMTTQPPMISRTSIFIISYALENMGLGHKFPPGTAELFIVLGAFGFIAYIATEVVASRRAAQKAATAPVPPVA
jgi:hypothetical protein